MNAQIIMSWSRALILMGKTGANDAMATTLFSPGVISDKSASLSVEDGDKLQAKATGGIVVAEEEGEPTLSLTFRVKEMDFNTENALTGATLGNGGKELTVKTHVITDPYSVKVVPKNIGSIGMAIRRSHVTFKPGYSEEEGQFVDVTCKVLACADGELYKKFRVTADDLGEVAVPTFSVAGNKITVKCATSGAAIQYRIDTDEEWQNYSTAIDATTGNNGKTLYAKATKGGKTSATATHTIEYNS